MKEKIWLFFRTYVLFIVLFEFQRIVFMLCYHHLYADSSLADYGQVLYHGLLLDASVAGYLTAIPGLLLVLSVWVLPQIIRRIQQVYFSVISVILSVILMLDLVLYGFWGFRLDTTPFFYFLSSPQNAIASVSIWFVILGVVGVLSLAFVFRWIFYRTLLVGVKESLPLRKRSQLAVVLFVLTGLLFIPIRGGVTTSTMSIGQAYFSDNIVLNHAAVNPAFSLLESSVKEMDFKKQFRFFDEDKAGRLFSTVVNKAPSAADSVPELFTVRRPNVIFIIMESFMSKTMATLGGLPHVAIHLDEIGKDGILFTNMYANSFRTDRGTVSILSGYPAQPTTSIMKYPKKTQSLPSIPRTLKGVGYDLRYYYGGDINFTNLKSYLVSMGFNNIVSDKDFPLSSRMSKWGVHDHLLFERAFGDIETGVKQPFMTVVQTSSSHEPYDVPFHRLQDKYLNSVAYTDSCIGQFIHHLKASPVWKNTVIVLVPDHATHYPQSIKDNTPERYQIPLIFTGGAVKQPLRIATYGSQIDIAATLLYQLRVSSKDFTFSKNMLNPSNPHFGFFTFPNFFGFVTENSQTVYDNDLKNTSLSKGPDARRNEERGKALLQKLYEDLSNR